MKVLAINGSLRKSGNTEALLKRAYESSIFSEMGKKGKKNNSSRWIVRPPMI